MADNLRSSASGQNPTFTSNVSKEEAVLGDKAVDGMDDDADHVPNVVSGLKAAISNPNTSEQASKVAAEKLKVLEGK